MALKTVIKRKVKVGSREYDCSLWPDAGGYNYEVYGPVAKLSGWVNGRPADAVKEATEHAREKFPKD